MQDAWDSPVSVTSILTRMLSGLAYFSDSKGGRATPRPSLATRSLVRATWGVVAALATALTLALPVGGSVSLTERFGVIDLHVDLPYQVGYKQRTLNRGQGQYVAGWLENAGVEGVVLPLYVPHEVSPRGPRLRDLEASYQRMLALVPETPPYRLEPCRQASGVGVFWAFEGAAPLGDELESVWRWGRRGLRTAGLVHAHDNILASSAGYGFQARRTQAGLSELGREVVRRLHATGAIIDVSHASDRAFDDILIEARFEGRPVVATHSNSRAMAPHTRNLSDQQLRAIGASGGVVGVNFHAPFLIGSAGSARLEDVVRHIRHIARVAGIDHVGIGSDFEGGIRPPAGLEDVRAFPRLARALRADGFSSSAVQRILAGNARRLLCGRPASVVARP